MPRPNSPRRPQIPAEYLRRGAGASCPWWLNEFNIAGVGQWNVLHRVNWGGKSPAVTVSLADLGLEPAADYLVYEFWTDAFLGIKRGRLELPEAGPHELRSYALRRLEDHPQIVSTNRHLSQGGADLLAVRWRGATLAGRSRVAAGDRYELAVHVPAGFALKSAEIAGRAAQAKMDGKLLRVAFMPGATGEVAWHVEFETPHAAQPPFSPLQFVAIRLQGRFSSFQVSGSGK